MYAVEYVWLAARVCKYIQWQRNKMEEKYVKDLRVKIDCIINYMEQRTKQEQPAQD